MKNDYFTSDPSDYIPTEPPVTERRTSIFIFPSSIRRAKYDSIQEIEPIFSVPCINCQNLINIEKIEDHSKTCLSITEAVINLESSSNLEQTRFKLEKLKNCLDEVRINPKLRPGDKNYVLILLRLIGNVLATPTKQEIDNTKNSLSSVALSFRGSSSIRIFIDRFQELLCQYASSIHQRIASINRNVDSIIKIKAQELEALKTKTEAYKLKSALLSNLLENTKKEREFESPIKIDEVNSEVCSATSYNSPATTVYYQEEQPLGNIDTDGDRDNAELKKFFYSLCLAQKIKNESQKMRINISAQKLYEEAIRRNVLPEKWSDFVAFQFANPDARFTQISHRRKRTDAKRKQNFEAIVEEDESLYISTRQ